MSHPLPALFTEIIFPVKNLSDKPLCCPRGTGRRYNSLFHVRAGEYVLWKPCVFSPWSAVFFTEHTAPTVSHHAMPTTMLLPHLTMFSFLNHLIAVTNIFGKWEMLLEITHFLKNKTNGRIPYWKQEVATASQDYSHAKKVSAQRSTGRRVKHLKVTLKRNGDKLNWRLKRDSQRLM